MANEQILAGLRAILEAGGPSKPVVSGPRPPVMSAGPRKPTLQPEGGEILGRAKTIIDLLNALPLGLLGNVGNPLESLDAAGPIGASKRLAKGASEKVFDFSPGFKSVQVGPTEIQLSVGKNGAAEVVMVKTPPDLRGQGAARKAMEQLAREADASGVRLELTPDPMDASTSKSGLTRFYESMGFKKNASDFSTRRTHIREPRNPMDALAERKW